MESVTFLFFHTKYGDLLRTGGYVHWGRSVVHPSSVRFFSFLRLRASVRAHHVSACPKLLACHFSVGIDGSFASACWSHMLFPLSVYRRCKEIDRWRIEPGSPGCREAFLAK